MDGSRRGKGLRGFRPPPGLSGGLPAPSPVSRGDDWSWTGRGSWGRPRLTVSLICFMALPCIHSLISGSCNLCHLGII